MKNLCVFCFFSCLLIFTGCFQPVEIGKTYVEKGTAYLRVSNASADEDYILEGLELRNAEGAAVWENLNLSKGQSCEVNTEMAGTFTLWYRVKDTWISASEVRAYEGGQVEIALNRSHEFSFEEGKIDVTQQDSDNDGYPDVWERENGFDPADPLDGGPVYVSANGLDEPEHGNGTQLRPYKTLAKAVDKAGRGLTERARTVVVLGELVLANGNDHLNLEYPGRSNSIFYLGKTRNCVTIQGENNAVLKAEGGGKRVLYLGPGADVVLRDITITGGKGIGGGIYASGAKLTLGSGAVVENNNVNNAVAGIDGGGIYMERGILVMEPGSSVSGNWAYQCGGVRLFASTLTMNGGEISGNYASLAYGGMWTENSIVVMLDGAEISNNTVGLENDDIGTIAGGVCIVSTELTMRGGSISDNIIYSGVGGGLYVAAESTLIMKGGEIYHNECTMMNEDTSSGIGGGVIVTDGSSFIMTGGSIKYNTAGKIGGGIYLNRGASFTIQGGTVYGQSAAVGEKNVATEGDSGKYGHAIYDARTEVTKVEYDTTLIRFPE